MTPLEKSNQLILKAYNLDQDNKTTQKQCKEIALLCVYEILNDNPNIYDSDRLNHKYWESVKDILTSTKQNE